MQNITLPEKIVITVTLLLLIVLSAGGYYAYTHLKPAQAQNELTTQALIEAVSKIAELPHEPPTIATVTDKEKLAQFTFFSQAQLGDKVLIFNDAKKAFLFRPSSNKIIEVGPIAISEEEPTPAPANEQTEQQASVAAVQTEPVTITLLNGTKGKGVAAKAESDLRQPELNIEIKTKGNSKKDYQVTQIAIINEEASRIEAEKIAQLFNAKIIELPKGELTPNTDLVVFLGNDRL